MSMGEESLTLKVAEALQDEVGYGRGRLDTVTRNELGLAIGDIVEIHGRRRDPTVAIVWRARTEDEGKGIIRVDGLIRNNAKVNLGDKVEVKKAHVKPAQKVVLAPMMDQSGRVQFGPGIEEVILRGLNRRPLTKGDVVIVPGLTLMGGRLPFAVTVVQPKGIVQIQADTVIQVHEDPVKEEELTTTGVVYEDIGGLKEEIKKVREEDKELKKDKDKYFAYLKDKDLECETQRERADYNEKEWLKLKKQVSSIAEEYLSTGDETLDEIREYIEAKTDEVVELKALCLENDIEY